MHKQLYQNGESLKQIFRISAPEWREILLLGFNGNSRWRSLKTRVSSPDVSRHSFSCLGLDSVSKLALALSRTSVSRRGSVSWSPVYTIQPVVKPVVKRVWPPVVSCIQSFNRLSKRLYNRVENRLYRVKCKRGITVYTFSPPAASARVERAFSENGLFARVEHELVTACRVSCCKLCNRHRNVILYDCNVS